MRPVRTWLSGVKHPPGLLPPMKGRAILARASRFMLCTACTAGGSKGVRQGTVKVVVYAGMADTAASHRERNS